MKWQIKKHLQKSININLVQSEEEYYPKDGGNTSDSDEAVVKQVSHHKERSKCTKCESSFLFKGSLKTNMNLPHTGPFKCHICTYHFKEKTKLIKHIKLIYSPTEDNISDKEDLATEKSLSSEVDWSQIVWER